MIEPTQEQIQAAQEIFEQWFCEDLGLDMEADESNWILKKMLTAALNVPMKFEQGTYPATVGGYVSVFQYKGKAYNLHCERGVRGIGFSDNVTVSEDGHIYSRILGKGEVKL